MNQNPLAQLRDIHMPDPVSWWPPAPGWWGLLLLILTLAAVYWGVRWRRAQQQKPNVFSQREVIAQALDELDRLEKLADSGGDACALAAELSALLRRAAIALKTGHANIAGLSGEAWLAWLDDQWDRDVFSHGAGRQLLDAPFQRHGQADMNALLQTSRDWLAAQR